MVEALISNTRSNYNKFLAKKSIIGLCYIMARIRNKFTNNLKLEIGLYLLLARTSSIVIDTLHSIEFSACYKTINNYKKKTCSRTSTKDSKIIFYKCKLYF